MCPNVHTGVHDIAALYNNIDAVRLFLSNKIDNVVKSSERFRSINIGNFNAYFTGHTIGTSCVKYRERVAVKKMAAIVTIAQVHIRGIMYVCQIKMISCV